MEWLDNNDFIRTFSMLSEPETSIDRSTWSISGLRLDFKLRLESLVTSLNAFVYAIIGAHKSATVSQGVLKCKADPERIHIIDPLIIRKYRETIIRQLFTTSDVLLLNARCFRFEKFASFPMRPRRITSLLRSERSNDCLAQPVPRQKCADTSAARPKLEAYRYR